MVTNLDKLKAEVAKMSAKEFADLRGIMICERIPEVDKMCDMVEGPCKQCIVNWLEKESEEI